MKLVIHIGYPKAASSFIQEGLFKNHPGLNYLNVNRPSGIYHQIYSTHTDDYDRTRIKEQAGKDIFPYLREDKINIIADERFTANIVDYRQIAQRLGELFPGAKILAIIRNQAEIIRSRYDMHPYDYADPSKKWLPFSEWLLLHLSNRQNNFLNSLFYFDTLRGYQTLFGQENVHFLLFEKLVARDAETVSTLARILELDVKSVKKWLEEPVRNPSGSHFLYHLKLKYLPRVHLSSFLPRTMVKGMFNFFRLRKKTQMLERDREMIAGIYGRNNLALQEYSGIDLSGMGYPLAEQGT